MRRSATPFLALLVLTFAAPALAWKTKLDSTGSPVRWSGDVTFVAQTDADEALGDPTAFAAIDAAVAALEEATPGLRLRVERGVTAGVGFDAGMGARNQNEIVVPQDWEFEPHLIAVTVVTLDTRTHEIIDADIAFNAAHRRFRVLRADSSAGGDYDDIQNALTHELGHAVGLAHNPEAPEAVMYPGARKGEINKRVLSLDDRQGLQAVYPAPAARTLGHDAGGEGAAGCTASGGVSALWVLLFVSPVLLRRKARRAAAVLGGAVALASGAAFADDALERASWVLTGEIVSSRTVAPSANTRLLWTELEVRVRECVRGPCPTTTRIRVPGGRVGDLEQVVEHHPVPEHGEVVAIAMPPADPQRPVSPRPKLFRIEHASDFVRFAESLSRAGMTAQVMDAVSPYTSRSPVTRP